MVKVCHPTGDYRGWPDMIGVECSLAEPRLTATPTAYALTVGVGVKQPNAIARIEAIGERLAAQ